MSRVRRGKMLLLKWRASGAAFFYVGFLGWGLVEGKSESCRRLMRRFFISFYKLKEKRREW